MGHHSAVVVDETGTTLWSRKIENGESVSAQTSMMREGPNRDCSLKKRGEGCKHVQAVVGLARRGVSVWWALLRDAGMFTSIPPFTQAA